MLLHIIAGSNEDAEVGDRFPRGSEATAAACVGWGAGHDQSHRVCFLALPAGAARRSHALSAPKCGSEFEAQVQALVVVRRDGSIAVAYRRRG